MHGWISWKAGGSNHWLEGKTEESFSETMLLEGTQGKDRKVTQYEITSSPAWAPQGRLGSDSLDRFHQTHEKRSESEIEKDNFVCWAHGAQTFPKVQSLHSVWNVLQEEVVRSETFGPLSAICLNPSSIRIETIVWRHRFGFYLETLILIWFRMLCSRHR